MVKVLLVLALLSCCSWNEQRPHQHNASFLGLCQVKCVLVLHLISAAFTTAALGLMSKHLPYRQDSYHCEHCRRLEQHAVVFGCFHTQQAQHHI